MKIRNQSNKGQKTNDIWRKPYCTSVKISLTAVFCEYNGKIHFCILKIEMLIHTENLIETNRIVSQINIW